MAAPPRHRLHPRLCADLPRASRSCRSQKVSSPSRNVPVGRVTPCAPPLGDRIRPSNRGARGARLSQNSFWDHRIYQAASSKCVRSKNGSLTEFHSRVLRQSRSSTPCLTSAVPRRKSCNELRQRLIGAAVGQETYHGRRNQAAEQAGQGPRAASIPPFRLLCSTPRLPSSKPFSFSFSKLQPFSKTEHPP